MQFSSTLLPTQPLSGYSAHLTQQQPTNYAQIALKADELTTVEGDLTSAMPPATPSVYALDFDNITTVISNGIIFTTAIDPQNPEDGEFTWNPYTKELRVYGATGRSLLVAASTNPVYTIPSPVNGPHPDILTKLPVLGDIQITRSFEQHPSAQFELEIVASKATIENILRPGGELLFYGLPLRINNISVTELPRAIYAQEYCKASISLGGKWENYLSDQVFLVDAIASPNDTPFTDPDCQNPTATNTPTQTTAQKLLAKANIPYTGPQLKPVNIPTDTAPGTTIDLNSMLSDRAIVANGFLFWSNPSAVEIRKVGSQRTWHYDESQIVGEIQATYEAIDKPHKGAIALSGYNPPAPDLVNFPSDVTSPPVPILRAEPPKSLGFQYPNTELTGEFNDKPTEPSEITQGQKPQYVRKEDKITTEIRGDKNAHIPLDGVTSIQSISLCFDNGGQTKQRTYITQRNGADWIIINEVWGFAFTAYQVTNFGTSKPSGDPNLYWKLLERTTAEYFYHETGYLLTVSETGFKTVRYLKESLDKPETLRLNPSNAKFALYSFFQIPVIKRTSYYLKLSPNSSTEGAYELYKACNRDGTSSLEVIFNPNYAPQYYIAQERTESSAYARIANPDSTNTRPLPDLEVGEESQFDSKTTIIPAEYKQILVGFDNGFPVYRLGEEISPQKWVKVNYEFKSDGPGMGEAPAKYTEETGTGDPPLAIRRPDIYVREETPIDQSKDVLKTESYRYFLQTDGYSKNDPVNGSESFPLAETELEAIAASRTKLAIENWRNGYSESLQIPHNLSIAEGDRFTYTCNGERRDRVVLSVSTTLNILGVVDGERKIVGVTSLSLGVYRLPPLTWNKILQPKEQDITTNIDITLVQDEAIASVLPWNTLKSRRNP